jgi:hypothetical protein
VVDPNRGDKLRDMGEHMTSMLNPLLPKGLALAWSAHGDGARIAGGGVFTLTGKDGADDAVFSMEPTGQLLTAGKRCASTPTSPGGLRAGPLQGHHRAWRHRRDAHDGGRLSAFEAVPSVLRIHSYR